jgi:hypothetical protein
MAKLGGVGAGSHNREEGRREEPLGGGLCGCSHSFCCFPWYCKKYEVFSKCIEKTLFAMETTFSERLRY